VWGAGSKGHRGQCLAGWGMGALGDVGATGICQLGTDLLTTVE